MLGKKRVRRWMWGGEEGGLDMDWGGCGCGDELWSGLGSRNWRALSVMTLMVDCGGRGERRAGFLRDGLADPRFAAGTVLI